MFSISPRPVRIPVITPLLERKNSSKKSPKVKKKSSEKSSFFSRSWRGSNKWKPNWKALGADKSKEWDVFSKDLKVLKGWLGEASDFTQSWRAPEHTIVSIRTQLERHLAFALEVKTHQYQLENILSRGRKFLDSFPQLGEVLEDTLAEIETRWSDLDSHLGIQSKQIQGALAVVETSIGSSSLEGADIEQVQDTLDHMTLRLTGHTFGVPCVEETHNSTAYSETRSASNTSQPLPCSSSPDFEALYSDLNDWLDDMQLAVTDSNDVFISEPQKEQMCQGYEQELQMREVSRSKLQRKGLQLMQSSNQNLAEQVQGRLDSLNQRWHALQAKLLSPMKPKAGEKKARKDSGIFSTSEEAMGVVAEVGDVMSRLKSWVTTMEGRLFSSQGSLENLTELQLEEKKTELEGLKEDIERHTPGIEMVLSLCDLLMVDAADLVMKREHDSLKLNAFNLDRRWQAIQAQSRDLCSRLERRIEEYKQMKIAEQPEQTLESFSPVRRSSLHQLWSMAPHRYYPTSSKDDDAVDGFTFRLNDLQRRIDIEELLIAREAFSENDAYSISDTSEISVGEFDFDDILPLKNGEDHVDADPGPGTPDIMEFADETFDKYMEMESALLQSKSEVSPFGKDDSCDPNSSKKDVEFWTISPRGTENYRLDSGMVEARISNLTGVERGIFTDWDEDNVDPTLYSGDEQFDDISELDERELLEEALWDLCSSSDEGENNDPPKMKPPSCEEASEAILQAFNFPPDIHYPVDVFGDVEMSPEHYDEQFSLPLSPTQVDQPALDQETKNARIPEHFHTLPDARPIPIPTAQSSSHATHADVKTILCQSWPMKTSSHSLSEKSPSIEDLMTTPSISKDIDRFFPSILGQELSFKETKRGLDSLRMNLKLTPSHASSLRQSREDLLETDNALLEITDKSLSHMYESLDLITELTSRLAADSLSTSPNSSDGYFSCLSDIDTASTSEARASMAPSDTDCDDMPRQEMAVRGTDNLFPVLFESDTESEYRAGNWYDEQEVPENTHNPSTALGAQYIHVDCTVQAACTIADTHNSQSEWEACIYDRLEASKELGILTNLESQESLLEGSPCVDENSDNMSAAVASLGSVESQGNPVATEELPCTFVNGSEELQVAKQGYMSYVSQLTEACGDGDLMDYLDSVKLKKCYLWSMAGSSEADPQGVEDPETKDMEKDLEDLLLKPGDLERKWDLDSQGSNDTDELIEASESLINELKNSNLAASSGPDGAGDWKDVIVLWLDKNAKDAASQGTEQAQMVEEGHIDRTEIPLLACGQDEADSAAARRLHAHDDSTAQVAKMRYSDKDQSKHSPPPSFTRRVLRAALPFQLILYLYILLVLLLPCVVETSTGDCYFSLSDNLLLDSHRLGPIINYVRGPPPM